MKLRFTARATQDLAAIADYIRSFGIQPASGSTRMRKAMVSRPSWSRGHHSAATGVTKASSNGGGTRFGAAFSSAINASFSRASCASRCLFHMLA
jgi:hypothetical protein